MADRNLYIHTDSELESDFGSEFSDDETDSEVESDPESLREGERNNFEPMIANEEEEDPLLYEGRNLTVDDACIIFMELKKRFKLNNTFFNKFLKVVHFLLPIGNKSPKSLHKFRKFFSDKANMAINKSTIDISRAHFCLNCQQPLDNPNAACQLCGELSQTGYWINFDISDQVRMIFARPGNLEKLEETRASVQLNPPVIKNITDGAEYQIYCRPGGFLTQPRTFSMMWSTDTVTPFKSSRWGFTPFVFSINEFDYEDRHKPENIITGGLWFGRTKPLFNLFLKGTRDGLQGLKEGVEVKVPNEDLPVSVRGVTNAGTADLQIKPMVMNMKQWNGKNGCMVCLQEGVRVPESNNRVFPSEPVVLRTNEGFLQDGMNAFRTGQPQNGVFGLTIMHMTMERALTSTGVDPMHNAFAGHVGHIFELLFDAAYANEVFSLRDKLPLLNSRQKKLTPTNKSQRLPRTFTDKKYWKAHEKKDWLLHYSLPTLQDVMPEEHFECHKLLVFALSILCADSITREQLVQAQMALDKYEQLFQRLYGYEEMFMNVHLLKHLPLIVAKLGPLWNVSCFPLEDYYGLLKRWIFGSKDPQLQIVSAVTAFFNYEEIKRVKMKPDSEAYDMYKEITCRHGSVKQQKIADDIFFVGAYRLKTINTLPAVVRQTIQANGIIGQKFVQFHRLKLRRTLFFSTSYRRTLRTNSTFALFDWNDEKRIGIIQYFLRVLNCNCNTFCTCDANILAILRVCTTERCFHVNLNRLIDDDDSDPGADEDINESISKLHRLTQISENLTIVPIANLRDVCTKIDVEGCGTFIAESINTVEKE